jgi:hypothetical protein
LTKVIKEIDEDDDTSITEGAKKISQLLRNFNINPPKYKSDLIKIADKFDAVKDQDTFNGALEKLYDLGDTDLGDMHGIIRHKLIWVDTMGLC